MSPKFTTEDEAVNWAIDLLRERGFSITRPAISISAGCTVGELRELCGNPHSSTFTVRLKHPDCPHFKRETGPSGRIVKLWPNPDLLTWLMKR